MGASWAKSQELPAGVSQVREHHDGGVPQAVNKPDRSELAHVSDAESDVSDPVSPPGHPGSVDPGTSSAVKSDVSSPVAESEVSPPVAVVEPSEDVLSEAAPSLTKFSPVAVVEPSGDLLSEAAPSLAKPGLSSSSSEQVPSTSAAPVPAPRARSQRRRRKAASPIRPVTRRYMCQGCELDYTITLEVVSCHQCKADITPESALLAFCEGPVCQSDNRLFLCQSCHDGNSDIADKDSRKRGRGDSSEGSASAKTLSKGKKIRKEPDSDSSLVIEEFPSESLRSVDGNESDSTVGSRSLIIDEDTSDASQAPSPDLVAKARAIVISSDLYKNKAVFVCNQFISHGCDELLHSFRSLKSHLAKAHGISGDIVPCKECSRSRSNFGAGGQNQCQFCGAPTKFSSLQTEHDLKPSRDDVEMRQRAGCVGGYVVSNLSRCHWSKHDEIASPPISVGQLNVAILPRVRKLRNFPES
uniref:Uncharacterized protein n=1 Tax=Branchiostoma floridae TaxID=7739 RepID=C3ZCM8_BRAFL|eukprot:XP_002593721.1 hypothetical protein BRAFLDRAFT_63993 [Branchiostoma floridae]